MKILITNIWQVENTGDNAIWKNMMTHLNRDLGNCEFDILSQTTTEWDMNELSNFNINVILNHIPNIEELEKYDAVISQGGGYMIGDGMVTYLELFKNAQSLGKPTFFGTQTFVGPIIDETKIMLAEVLNNATFVAPREQITYNFLIDCGVNPDKLTLLPDAVFSIDPIIYNNKKIPKDSIKIGIRSYSAPKKYLKEIAKFADMVSEALGTVVLIPIGHGGDRDDIIGAKYISNKMKHKSIIIDDKVNANELEDILKDGILVTDRYHGAVYALSMCTPIVTLSPDIDYKMPGLLNLVDYKYKTIFDNNVKAKDLFTITYEIWKDRDDIRKKLSEIMPTIKLDSIKVYKYITEAINDSIKK